MNIPKMIRYSIIAAAGLQLIGTVLLPPLWAQQDHASVDAISVRTPGDDSGLTQLDLYTAIAYSALRFEPGPRGFTATYQVQAEITALDAQGRPTFVLQSPIWDRSITVPLFAETTPADQFDVTTHSVHLAPGPYLLTFQITDRSTSETLLREQTITVRDLGLPLALSDIVLLDSYDSATNAVHPRVSGMLGGEQLSFDVFFELYTDRPRTLTMIRELLPVYQSTSSLSHTDLLAELRPVFADTTTTEIAAGRHQMVSQFSTSDLGVGTFKVRIRVLDDTHSAAVERTVVSEWSGLASYLDDLDQAIKQMVYAGSRRELQRIRGGATEAERRRLFNEFWKKRDPTPETTRNEQMEQYFYRVSVATRRYSSVRPGWQTDRGHVLILHGDPEDVNRQTYSFNAEPYEVWYYYRIGRRYVFVDATGFGDYELLVPIWDDRTRIR